MDLSSEERTRESGTKKKTRRSRCRETDRRKTPRDTESAGQAGRFVPFGRNEKETKGGKREETAGRPRCYSQGERSVHSLSDQKLKATLNEMNAFTCLLHLPRHIHSPFHFKCSAALLWVAALSPRPSRCTHRSFCLSLSLSLERVIYCIRENFVVYVHLAISISCHRCPFAIVMSRSVSISLSERIHLHDNF